MTRRWLVLADDLTGAADCAIALGRRGLAAVVIWGDIRSARSRQEPILAYDTASEAGVRPTDLHLRNDDGSLSPSLAERRIVSAMACT